MTTLYPIHITGFVALQYDNKKSTEILGKEILCTIFYLGNSDKARFSDLKKRVENDYVFSKE